MTKSLIISFCFVFGFIGAQEKPINNSNIIQWQKDYRLKVEDFQKEFNSKMSHSHAAYKIEFYPSSVVVDVHDYIQGYENLTVVAEFHKNESHFNPEYEKDLLEYERLTFDIAELFARKIRKRFKKLKAQKEKRFSAYNYEYGVLWKACKQYQLDFNRATNSGWDSPKAMTEWEVKILHELRTLQFYAIKSL